VTAVVFSATLRLAVAPPPSEVMTGALLVAAGLIGTAAIAQFFATSNVHDMVTEAAPGSVLLATPEIRKAVVPLRSLACSDGDRARVPGGHRIEDPFPSGRCSMDACRDGARVAACLVRDVIKRNRHHLKPILPKLRADGDAGLDSVRCVFEFPIAAEQRVASDVGARRDIGISQLGKVVQQALSIAVGSDITAIKKDSPFSARALPQPATASLFCCRVVLFSQLLPKLIWPSVP